MIWDHDKYWKASPGSTLKGSNNGLTIFYDLDEFLNKREILFFENVAGDEDGVS